MGWTGVAERPLFIRSGNELARRRPYGARGTIAICGRLAAPVGLDDENTVELNILGIVGRATESPRMARGRRVGLAAETRTWSSNVTCGAWGATVHVGVSVRAVS